MERDKLLHMAAGAVIALAVFVLTGSACLGALAGILAGIACELWQGATGRGVVDWWDAAATAAGAVAGAAWAYVVPWALLA